MFVPEIMHPFPVKALQNFLEGRRDVAVLEMNYQGQLFQYLKSLGVLNGRALSLKRSGGIPFQLEEVQRMIQEAFKEVL